MPILTSPLGMAYAQGGPTSKVQTPYSAGTVTMNVTFPIPMPNNTYTPTFSLGSGVAIPAITVSNKTVNGYTFSFLAATAGSILATVLP